MIRRRLVLASLGLTLLGLELSTRAVSLALSRLGAGFQALFAGVPFQVGGGRFVLGFVLLVGGVALGGMTLWSSQVWRGVTGVGRRCPECGERTRRLRRRRLHRMVSRLTGERLTRRSCERCGWSGLAIKR